MYKFPLKLKIVSISLMILGLALTVVSFLSTPNSKAEVEEILKHQKAHGHHVAESHKTVVTKDIHFDKSKANSNHTDVVEHDSDSLNKDSKHENVSKHVSDTILATKKDVDLEKVSDVAISDKKVSIKLEKDTLSSVANGTSKKSIETEIKKDTVESIDKTKGAKIDNFIVDTYTKDTDLKAYKAPNKYIQNIVKKTHHSLAVTDQLDTKHASPQTEHISHEEEHAEHLKHVEHVFHQLTNRPTAAFYVALIFFLGVTLLVMAFYAGQRIAQSGWSVVLFRVFEAISCNLHYVSIVMLLFIIGTTAHKFHLFPWMKDGILDPQHPNYDSIIYGKKWWMNIPGWTIRSVSYLVIWNCLRLIIRKMSIKQDNGDLKLHKRLFNMSVVFLATFFITESMASWDWIMGIDPHWFSTLFGWYVLASFLVCALTVTAMVTIYLRSKGALPLVNDSHIHDLAKFMFGFSVFWTYLWFAQYMLVWYADMPEETTYYLQRFNDYQVLFGSMVVMNFIFPVLILLNSDFKSIPWFVILAGIIILCGHYLDFYIMIMPGTVGDQYGFGFGEFGGILFFIGLFIFATFNAFSKADPVAKGSPFLHESETFHYYIIEHRGEENEDH